MPETRTHQVLRSRLDYLEQHHETVDASMRVAGRRVRNTRARSLAAALGFSNRAYPRLTHPPREMERVFSFSRAKNNEMLVTQTYVVLSEYLRGILHEVYKTKPLQVVGETTPHKIEFHRIVELGGWDSLVEHMVEKVFRSLENEQDTRKLIEKVLKKAGAGLPEALDEAVQYLEMRHLFVHNGGIADEPYKKKYGVDGLRDGDHLPTDSTTARTALASIRKLAREIDGELLIVGAVQPWNAGGGA
jgi:hypothetical protein